MRIPCLTVPAMTVALPKLPRCRPYFVRSVGAYLRLRIERQIVLGCFMDPSSQMISEATVHRPAGERPHRQCAVGRACGDESARTALKDANIPQYSPFDVDPHAEYEVGDVDNTVRYAASLAANGHSIVVDGTFPKGTAEQAVAIASRCLMNGRSVLYVPGVAEQKRLFIQTLAN